MRGILFPVYYRAVNEDTTERTLVIDKIERKWGRKVSNFSNSDSKCKLYSKLVNLDIDVLKEPYILPFDFACYARDLQGSGQNLDRKNFITPLLLFLQSLLSFI